MRIVCYVGAMTTSKRYPQPVPIDGTMGLVDIDGLSLMLDTHDADTLRLTVTDTDSGYFYAFDLDKAMAASLAQALLEWSKSWSKS